MTTTTTPATTMSFEDLMASLNDGQKEAYLRKVWKATAENPELMLAILRDEYKLRIEDATIKFVDSHGRVIPLKGMTGVVDANTSFRHVQPAINITDIYHRIRKHFGPEAKLPNLEDFGTRYVTLQEEVAKNRQVNNLFKGSWFPICIPQTDPGDYGTIFETKYLSAAESAYLEAFPNRKFYNHRKGTLTDKVTVNEGTRHELLVERLKQGPVTGLYFSSPLQGFGIEADRSIIRHLPEGFCLSGGFDAATAHIADPKTMAQGYNTPATDCAALSWQGPEFSLCFRPRGDNLRFGFRLLGAYDDYSAGLFFFR